MDTLRTSGQRTIIVASYVLMFWAKRPFHICLSISYNRMASSKTKIKDTVDRDVSWMYFNQRILQEAKKENVPLLERERLSFLGIYSNNLDEFFRVRVASLTRMLSSNHLSEREEKALKRTIKTIYRLNEAYSREYAQKTDEVFAALEKQGIRMLNETQLNAEQQEFLRGLFYNRLNGMTNPIWLSAIDNFSFLEDNRIYLIVSKTPIEGGKTKYAIIKVPDRQCGRFVTLPPSDGYANIMYLDDVVRFCLPLIFIGTPASEYAAYSFKFTKDAEMEVDNEGDYGAMEKIARGVSSRTHGEAIRVLYDAAMPRSMRDKIIKRLHMGEHDTLLATRRYQNHKDVMSFPDCGRNDLKYPQRPPLNKPEFQSETSILQTIRERDRFVHVPYHSFNAYIRLLREAALSSDVKEIKTTIYRLASDSKVVKALICAARNGKKVTAVVELLARFDEESNIKWSKRMQAEGVNVVFGVEGLKIHSKLLHISSKRGDIACVGTGNFHEGNAKVYTDYLMMTARPRIVNEVARVFDFIDRPFAPPRFRELLVSPNAMKARILRLIEQEVKAVREGREAWIKINRITDADLVNALYAAAEAGVQIDIALRGKCALVPSLPRLGGRLRAVGIIDRYLEHSRVLIFANGGRPKYYLGSADWMPRNLVNRIEVMTPVYDADLQADLLRCIDFAMRDTANARMIDGFGTNAPVLPAEGEARFCSQEALYAAYMAETSSSF